MNLSDIQNATTTAVGLSNLILVTPEDTGYQPQNPKVEDGEDQEQPPGFLFDYEGEQTVGLTSDITDHWAEDNKSLQDQIALRPVLVTTHGYIGELNNVAPKALRILKTAAQKLTSVSAYAPSISITAQNAYNTAFAAYQTASTIARNSVASWDTINGNSQVTTIDGQEVEQGKNQNKQQVAFQKFYGYWSDRTLFTIQTPWAVFKNMAIQSLRAIQGEETKVITDFEITFKQMRFAETLVVQGEQTTYYDSTQFQGRAFNQGAPEVDLGVSTPSSDGTGLSAFGVA